MCSYFHSKQKNNQQMRVRAVKDNKMKVHFTIMEYYFVGDESILCE